MKRTLAFLLLAMLVVAACAAPASAPAPVQPAAQQSTVITVFQSPT